MSPRTESAGGFVPPGQNPLADCVREDTIFFWGGGGGDKIRYDTGASGFLHARRSDHFYQTYMFQGRTKLARLVLSVVIVSHTVYDLYKVISYFYTRTTFATYGCQTALYWSDLGLLLATKNGPLGPVFV